MKEFESQEGRAFFINSISKEHVTKKTKENTRKIREKYRGSPGKLIVRKRGESFRFDCSKELNKKGLGFISSSVIGLTRSKRLVEVQTKNSLYTFFLDYDPS